MARIRSVHPDICIDEVLAETSPRAERTFVRLWTHLDDEGRCVDNPKLIKAALYPLHDDMTAAEVDIDLWEPTRLGLLWRYQVDGKCVISAKPESWKQRQRPKHPTPSKLAAPPDDYTPPEPPGNTYPTPTVGRGEPEPTTPQGTENGEQSCPTPGLPQAYPQPGNTYPESLHGVVDVVGEGEGVGGVEGVRAPERPGTALTLLRANGTSPAVTEIPPTHHTVRSRYPNDFEAWWTLYPRKQAKAAAAKAWRNARANATWEQLTEGLRKACTTWAQGDPQFIPHAATWLNGRRWEDEPTAPTAGRRRSTTQDAWDASHQLAATLDPNTNPLDATYGRPSA